MIKLFKKRKVNVRIRAAAGAKIHQAAEVAAPHETGGLLLGWWEKGTIIIENVIVLNDSNATTHSWIRHEAEAQAALDRVRDTHRSAPLGYVGDWHCHPADVGASNTDIMSLKTASTQYRSPLVLIVRKPNDKLEFHVAERGKVRTVQVVE
jgi:integrative and conjugative element protein (TIGR02256 family)